MLCFQWFVVVIGFMFLLYSVNNLLYSANKIKLKRRKGIQPKAPIESPTKPKYTIPAPPKPKTTERGRVMSYEVNEKGFTVTKAECGELNIYLDQRYCTQITLDVAKGLYNELFKAIRNYGDD